MIGHIAFTSIFAVVALSTLQAQRPASTAPSSPIIGRWITNTDNGRVEISPCGSEYCGRVISSDFLNGHPGAKDVLNRNPALRDRPAEGLEILKGFSGGPKVWKGGTVYNPADGGTYSGSIRLDDNNHLKLRGCIIYPLCRTEVWTRDH